MNVTITPVTEPDELYCHYSGQFQTQQAILSLDLESGEMTCSYNAEIGTGIPASVYHQRTIWLDIPTLTADAANQLMDDVEPLAQRIVDGAEIEWDGNNHVGSLNEDAQAALDEMAAACAEENFDATSTVNEFAAADWYIDLADESIARLGLTADSTDVELEQMADAEQKEARTADSNSGYTVLVGAVDWLHDRREELRDATREQLGETAEKLVELEAMRDSGIQRLATWGDSSRAIGGIVGLSHTRVQQIAKQES